MEKINEAISRVLEFQKGIPLCNGTLRNYKCCYRMICDFCESNGIIEFGDSEAELFTINQMLQYEKGEFSVNYFRRQRKAASLLADQMQNRKLKWGYKTFYLRKLNEHFETTLARFKEFLAEMLAPGTCKGVVSVARQLLLFLEDDGIYDFSLLASNDVKRFIIETSPRYNGCMQTLTGSIKKFLSFLNDAKLAIINADGYLSNPASPHKKVLPCITEKEAEAIFASVDISTPIGKRDYAVMKLAIGTGLRSVDIFGMKLSDIDWYKNEIHICQAKTKVCNTLPLLPDVGNAIMDYILNGRPKVKNPYVFLRDIVPYDRIYARTAGNHTIQRYLEMAGINHKAGDGKTFHAFRRTTGTRLVRSGENLESVRQIMGPRSTDSLKRYIALDEDGLRVCCLDMSQYATAKEGLV